MNKKGVEITFNWIFSLIVGAIIFSFFVYFAVQHTDLFGRITARQVAWELDNVFSGFKTSKVETSLDFDKTIELKFDCDDTIAGSEKQEIWINGKGKQILRDKLVFAPFESKNSKFYLYTAEWKVPYKVGMFIFLSNDRERYDLINDEDLVELEMPEFFGELRGSDPDAKKIKFIKSNFPCDAVSDKTVVHYNYDVANKEYYGWICPEDGKPYGFYGNAMIYAAIFLDSKEFECMYELMMRKLRLVSELYYKKAGLIDGSLPINLKSALTRRSSISKIIYVQGPGFKEDVDIIRGYNDNRLSGNEILLY